MSITSTEINKESVLPSKIPLKIPMYSDPRKMTKKQLLSLVNEEHRLDSKDVLVARVLQDVVVNGLEINFNDMDDRQPEKWIHIANLMLQKANELEPNPIVRVKMMKNVNEYLKTLTTNSPELMEIATGMKLFPEKSSLYSALIRLGAALMLEPVIEFEMEKLNSNKKSSVAASVTIFQMATGFMGIPKNLSLSFALGTFPK